MELFLALFFCLLLYYMIRVMMESPSCGFFVILIVILLSAIVFSGAAIHPGGPEGFRQWNNDGRLQFNRWANEQRQRDCERFRRQGADAATIESYCR